VTGDLLFVVVALGLVGFGAILAWRNDVRRWAIERGGILRAATISEVQTLVLDGGAPSFKAKYHYLDDAGVEHHGWSPQLGYDPTLRSTGNQCEIRFDAQRPERSVWIEGTS
jgi:hypothetical protein